MFVFTNKKKVASVFKVLTALVSITTALFLFRVSPRVLLALQEVSSGLFDWRIDGDENQAVGSKCCNGRTNSDRSNNYFLYV